MCVAGCTSAASWRSRLASPDPLPAGIAHVNLAVDGADDVIVTGALASAGIEATPSGGDGGTTLWVAKLSGEGGATLWRRSLGRSNAPELSLVVAAGRDPVVGASLAGPDAAGLGVVRIDGKNGAERWRHVASLPGSAEQLALTELALDPRGEVIAAGFLTDGGASGMTVFKLAASDGRELWRHGAGAATSIVATRAGDAILTGTAPNESGGHDLVATSLDGLDGAELWRRSIGSSRPGETFAGAARALELGGGDVIAAQLLSTSDDRWLLLATRIDPRSGAARWTEHFESGPGPVLRLALGGHDSVVVTTTGAAGGSVLELAASDGGEIWRRPLDSESPCGAVAVSVDYDGDILAAACELGGDAKVLKLRGRDGRLLWQSRIGASIPDAPYALAVDASGDVVIARYVASAEERADLVVTKLRGRDGRLPRPDAREVAREAPPAPGVSAGESR